MKELQNQIGKEFYYIRSGGLSDDYMVEIDEVGSVEVTEHGLVYKRGSQTYTKSGGKYGKKCFTDLKKAQEYAQQLNRKRYEHNKELIEKDDRIKIIVGLSNPID